LLLLYVLIALAMLWPYRKPDFRLAGDLNFVLGFITESRNALKEGQFPIRVAPKQWEKMRFPLFQYYGNFPYTVTGFIARFVGDNPYTAWKITMLLTFVGGAIGAEKLAYVLTRRRDVAVIAAMVFLIAPYQFTDMNARGALSEQVAFNLLPAAFYLSYRAFLSRRKRYVLACAVAWTLIGLTHNIAYVYGVLFMGLLFLSYLRWDGRSLQRIGRLAAAGAVHAVLILWYFIPQLVTLKVLVIGSHPFDPYLYADLAPLYVLLSPRLTATPAASTAPGLGLQVGWPILAGVLLTLVTVAFRGRAGFRRATALRLMVLFAGCFCLAWSPFDFWKHLPSMLWFVQFPYRMLIFVVLFGSMLAAIGLSAWFPRRIPLAAVGLIAALLAASTVPFIPPDAKVWPMYVQQQMIAPDIGAAPLDAYLVSPKAVAQTSWLTVDFSRVEWQHVLDTIANQRSDPALKGGRVPVAADKRQVRFTRTVRYAFTAPGPVMLELPVFYYPHVLAVQDNGKKIKYGNVGHFLAVKLPPGQHRITVRYVGIGWANLVSALAWSVVALIAVIAAARGLAASCCARAGALRMASGQQRSDQLLG
jgi:hypothetical protein